MTTNQVRILTAIKKRDGNGYAYALANDLDIPLGAVHKALRALSRHGYINSTLVASDAGPARRVWDLSPQGRHALRPSGEVAA